MNISVPRIGQPRTRPPEARAASTSTSRPVDRSASAHFAPWKSCAWVASIPPAASATEANRGPQTRCDTSRRPRSSRSLAGTRSTMCRC